MKRLVSILFSSVLFAVPYVHASGQCGGVSYGLPSDSPEEPAVECSGGKCPPLVIGGLGKSGKPLARGKGVTLSVSFNADVSRRRKILKWTREAYRRARSNAKKSCTGTCTDATQSCQFGTVEGIVRRKVSETSKKFSGRGNVTISCACK